MNWYRVTKTIRGKKYDYWQKTYREGGRVKTLNKYIGPATPSTPSPTTLYRGGGPGFMPRGLTAAEVVRYEREDLGNTIAIENGINLAEVKSERLVWLAETSSAAREYGTVEKVQGTFRIIARDSYKGLLVEEVQD